jgi:pyruvate/2-oxoglutarate dehydrogenase complex dihydrolipoamide dehydrogenase (E3) component
MRLRLLAVRPATYDLIVIGSGPAGEKGAARAAYFGKRVALVEHSETYGGAIANTGVPGKAMRETALYLSGFRKRDLRICTSTPPPTPSAASTAARRVHH